MDSSHNAAISRSVCGVCIVVKLSDSETTMQTPRTLTDCMALLGLLHLKLA